MAAFTQTASGRIERVRRFNDVLRRYHLGGQVVVSAGVHALLRVSGRALNESRLQGLGISDEVVQARRQPEELTEACEHP